ncbi:holo-ACP synthase CitX [Kineosphaera limosa]|uniref:Apo-citrate lyase phosphoribosyl-dephospho-CoA transferase/2-(5''-triphosphoribosyl)-3'-dephosphocoenzyme-A synthase n=1 Tax=Kineosphaera limosa NBRC 100340 TaxID=1184609 RepID=K6VIH8_9MICO|nr:citrate lyase holo-[acyl-carrier protein] synthase [Kineosphaera limosa]NYE02435.1 holo-ACP synthase CitX [Kineosphaera limosa]GAB96038.1 apo-citrate lyase phosphoribosyl-dephospho-CoA transferase/2-(5''-triphosphoribosyl)-3'-dephosphocoenzyme-A synthase [Kineosphaera limosa NBRC 100340]
MAAVSPARILARREERRGDQLRLLARASAVVSVTIVSPGPDKDDRTARHACTRAVAAVQRRLRESRWPVLGAQNVRAATGPEYLVAVEAPAVALKEALVDLEETHALGRLWDLDVVTGPDVDGLPVIIGRSALHRRPRRCLVCEQEAAGCARSARHPLAQVLASRRRLVAAESQSQTDADLAVRALITEARLSPKPGLVDSFSTGSHDDMDLALLERSARALRPWLRACWLTGARQPGSVEPLVRIGVAAEADLMAVTGGVNTHRGALFAMGLLMGALGAEHSTPSCAAFDGCRLERLRGRVADLAAPLLQTWQATASGSVSHGSAAFRALGVTGARGEAASGFATAATIGLPAYRERRRSTGDEDDAQRWALVNLMAENADTNLVHRGGEPGLRFARTWARELVERRPDPAALTAAMSAAEAPFVARRLSPGGSADLLALTWLLDRLAPIA